MQTSGADPANQVTGLKLEILGDHAFFKLRTHPFLKRFHVMLCKPDRSQACVTGGGKITLEESRATKSESLFHT